MRKLLDLFLGALFGSVVAFFFFNWLFEEDVLQKEISKRTKEAQCKAYEEELQSSYLSPESHEKILKAYETLCKR